MTSPLRFVTAASLFDGHDASINIMRRVLQSEGAEVIHLGHDRGVQEIVDAAIEEDAHGIAVSSYQGGHVEFFTYMVDLLRERGRPEVRVFGGGGGTITDREAAQLHAHGVERIYSVEDGRRLGLVGMIRDMMARAQRPLWGATDQVPTDGFFARRAPDVARALTAIEALNAAAEGGDAGALERLAALRASVLARGAARAPVLGITGTGSCGACARPSQSARSRSSRSTRRDVAPGARCWATGFG